MPPRKPARAITLFLSPHLDDVVFSAGALVASLPAGEAVIATCFTASVPDPKGFAMRCQTDKGFGPEVDYMAVRRDEDVRACDLLGADCEHLGLPEAPHRGYDSPEALFGGVRDDDTVGPKLDEQLRALIGEHSPSAVAYPQSVGDHVDHQQVAASVERLRPTLPGIRWVRYYDQPYTARHRRAYPELSFARRVRGLAEVGEDVCVFTHPRIDREPAGHLATKVRAAAAYASQVGYQFYEAAGLRREDEPDELARIAHVLGHREWVISD